MRTYPTDSPRAVCRLLALAMIVDGHLAPSELRALRHSGILQRVGVDEALFDDVVQEVCEDLLAAADRRSASDVEIDSRMLDTLLREIRDPALQMALMKAMLDIVHADAVLDGRESLLIQRGFKAWGGPPPMPAPAALRSSAGSYTG
jgi:uncharacterized tellurite resistance protein B-like protein